MIKYLLGLSCLLFLSACSSTGLPDNMRADFKTRITSSGLKHFQLQLVPDASTVEDKAPKKRRSPSGGSQQGRPNPERQARNIENMLLSQAEELIEINGFCSEGFWLLDKSLYQRMPYIRAECNEAATQEDRALFPDTLHRW